MDPAAAPVAVVEEDPDDMEDTPLVLLTEGFLGGFSNGRVKEGVLVLVEPRLGFVFELELELL